MPKEGPVEPPLLTPEARVASVAAWCSARTGSAVALCSHGLYADQVRAVAEAFPASELVVGLGSDKVLQLLDPAWYEDRDAALADLFGRARVAYAARLGDEGQVGRVLEEETRWAERLERLEMPAGLAEVSSSEVRRRIRRGEHVDALVPAEVLPYVRSSPPGSS
jgi:nicotinic acid mononucleotide adenylyltransferase